MIMQGLSDDLKDLDRSTRYLMDEGIDAEWLEYVLYETDAYYSDRRVGKYSWIDEPRPQPATRYPKVSKSSAAAHSMTILRL